MLWNDGWEDVGDPGLYLEIEKSEGAAPGSPER